MQPEHLVTTAAMAACLWALGATTALLLDWRRPRWWGLGYALSSWVMLLIVLGIDQWISLGHNTVLYLLDAVTSGDPHQLCAAGLGGSIGLMAALWPWQARLRTTPRGARAGLVRLAGFVALLALFGFLGLLATQEKLRPYVRTRNLTSLLTDLGAYSVPPGFRLEEFHTCETAYPVQIALGPDGDLYATAYWGAALQDGVVLRIATGSSSNTPRERIVARNLSRPHGLAFWAGQLYVSRCGQYVRAESGSLVGVNTGAVTRMRDLDQDGLMDYFEDVVADLPGAQGPDPLHQNNGIAFNAQGDLFVTVGRHADRSPATKPWEGTVIRVPAGHSTPEVFAEGFRNPFDLVVGPDQQLFASDNDASDRRHGDEINHLRAGQHYGFPYADGEISHPAGTTPPLFAYPNGTCQGITYTNSEQLPRDYRNCLYVVSYGSGEILRVRLRPEGETYHAEIDSFARIPSALDITVDEQGIFYISCFENKKILRLIPNSLGPSS